MDSSLQVIIFGPVVELILQSDDLLQLPNLPVRFVTDKRAVKVNGKYDENDPKRYHDAGWCNGSSLSRTYGDVFLLYSFEG